MAMYYAMGIFLLGIEYLDKQFLIMLINKKNNYGSIIKSIFLCRIRQHNKKS